MNKDKDYDNRLEESYDQDVLTDLHSSETNPSSYARNIRSNLGKADIKNVNGRDLTERVPSAVKFSDPDIKKNDDEFDYQGEL